MLLANSTIVKTSLYFLSITMLLSACNGLHSLSSEKQERNLATIAKPTDLVKVDLPANINWAHQSNMTSLGLGEMYYPATESDTNWTQAFFIFQRNQTSASVLANQQIDAVKEVCPNLKVISNDVDAAHNTVLYVQSAGSDCTMTIPRNKTQITKIFPTANKGLVTVQYIYVEGKVLRPAVEQGFAAVKGAHA